MEQLTIKFYWFYIIYRTVFSLNGTIDGNLKIILETFHLGFSLDKSNKFFFHNHQTFNKIIFLLLLIMFYALLLFLYILA